MDSPATVSQSRDAGRYRIPVPMLRGGEDAPAGVRGERFPGKGRDERSALVAGDLRGELDDAFHVQLSCVHASLLSSAAGVVGRQLSLAGVFVHRACRRRARSLTAPPCPSITSRDDVRDVSRDVVGQGPARPDRLQCGTAASRARSPSADVGVPIIRPRMRGRWGPAAKCSGGGQRGPAGRRGVGSPDDRPAFGQRHTPVPPASMKNVIRSDSTSSGDVRRYARVCLPTPSSAGDRIVPTFTR